MKNKDFIRLAKYSIKNNKIQTSNTVRGIVFGATLLITLFFVLLSFYAGTMSRINKEKTISSFRIKYPLINKDSENLNEKIKNDILSNSSINDSIIYNQINLSYYYINNEMHYPTITIDGIDYLYDYNYRLDLQKSSDELFFYDMVNSTTLITKEEELFLRSNKFGEALLAGSIFGENVEEVIISSQVLDYFKINYEDVIGKTVSYTMDLNNWSSAYDMSNNKYDSSFQGKKVTIINNYKIVGVFNSKLYLSPSRGEDYSYCPSLWLKKDSIYNSNDISYYFGEEQIDGFIYQKNPLEVFTEAIDNKKVAIPYGFNYHYNVSSLRYMNDFTQIIQFNNFKSAYSYNKVLKNYSNKYSSFEFQDNSVFSNYIQFYPLIILISITFLIFGGVIFFATIINLYNIMLYSIEKRKNYLAMCKAIGMTNKDVLKLYFYEICLILFRSVIWIISLTFLLCLLITITFNDMIEYKTLETVISYKFDFIYYPVILFPSLIVLLIIASLISLFVCKSKDKHNIVDLLN